jgi:polyisoprenoid-binding protein YceI
VSRSRTGLRNFAAVVTLVVSGLPMSGCSNPADDKFQAQALPAGTPAEVEAKPDAPSPEVAGAVPVALPEGAKKVQAVAADSKVEFTGSKVTGSHSGGFKAFTAEAVVDPAKKALIDFSATIDMNSTWSDNDRLTGHLKNQDFFDVPKFPTSTFATTKVAAGGDVKLAGSNTMITGNLTLHGVTKQISFPAKVEVAESGVVKLDTEFAINRKDFGIVYGGKADDLIRDEVVIRLAVKAQ